MNFAIDSGGIAIRLPTLIARSCLRLISFATSCSEQLRNLAAWLILRQFAGARSIFGIARHPRPLGAALGGMACCWRHPFRGQPQNSTASEPRPRNGVKQPAIAGEGS